MSKTIIKIENYDNKTNNYENIKRYVHLYIDNNNLNEKISFIKIPKYINNLKELNFHYKKYKYDSNNYEIDIKISNKENDDHKVYNVCVILADNIKIVYYKKYKKTIYISLFLFFIMFSYYLV
jgi:hypothetical protein